MPEAIHELTAALESLPCVSAAAGRQEYRLDGKGRLVIPARYDGWLGSPVVLLALPDARLGVVTAGAWDLLASRLPKAAWELISRQEVDASTNRMLIPYPLRQHARLLPGDEVEIAGRGSHLELALYLAPGAAPRAGLPPPPLDAATRLATEWERLQGLATENQRLREMVGTLASRTEGLARELKRVRAGGGRDAR